eukprot:1150706-Pelagomonas_calceolata.AAC.12
MTNRVCCGLWKWYGGCLELRHSEVGKRGHGAAAWRPDSWVWCLHSTRKEAKGLRQPEGREH